MELLANQSAERFHSEWQRSRPKDEAEPGRFAFVGIGNRRDGLLRPSDPPPSHQPYTQR
jgi:hypothetical protein